MASHSQKGSLVRGHDKPMRVASHRSFPGGRSMREAKEKSHRTQECSRKIMFLWKFRHSENTKKNGPAFFFSVSGPQKARLVLFVQMRFCCKILQHLISLAIPVVNRLKQSTPLKTKMTLENPRVQLGNTSSFVVGFSATGR